MKICPCIILLFIIFSFPLSLDAQPNQLPPLLATREEVNRFFANYVERYNQKEIDGFLSLFSSKAIQNRKDDLEAIQRIYSNFFNQSLELRYQIDGLTEEIYQNAVVVKARYEIHQVLKGSQKQQRSWHGHIRWILVKENGALKILSLDYQHEKVP